MQEDDRVPSPASGCRPRPGSGALPDAELGARRGGERVRHRRLARLLEACAASFASAWWMARASR